ncbi:hypothetical protein [Phycicoccus duodecadis]|uniref:Uncharacterized protein n=1 Tax=Phycicoccus duodecadis TaxID=173053 RepID=A0A2N3YLD7_9MICO|nr:hypothetical protein [Phycicoccus duodecadis]PKW27681.1 hypothetical protein ATL31_2532 [Phycicoccus duodecadis]
MRPPSESEVTREYRHLLRTASGDWQETAHRHALLALGPTVREQLLGELRRILLTGYHVAPDDVHALARILVRAERRRPRVLLDALRPALLDVLATAVVASPTGGMLRAGIDVWDGADPALVPDPPVEPDHHQQWLLQRATPGAEGDAAAFRPALPADRRRAR